MTQLDRIEAKLNLLIELMSVQGAFIASPHSIDPRTSWLKATQLYDETVKKYTKMIDENTDNSSGEPDSIS